MFETPLISFINFQQLLQKKKMYIITGLFCKGLSDYANNPADVSFPDEFLLPLS